MIPHKDERHNNLADEAACAVLRLDRRFASGFDFYNVVQAYVHTGELALDLPYYYACDLIARLWWDGELEYNQFQSIPTWRFPDDRDIDGLRTMRNIVHECPDVEPNQNLRRAFAEYKPARRALPASLFS